MLRWSERDTCYLQIDYDEYILTSRNNPSVILSEFFFFFFFFSDEKAISFYCISSQLNICMFMKFSLTNGWTNIEDKLFGYRADTVL